MADGFGSWTHVASLNIGLDVLFQARPIVFLVNKLLCLINFKMSRKWIIIVTTYYLGTDKLWDVWEASVLKYSLIIFSALQKACCIWFERLHLFIVILQLRHSLSHISNINNVRTVWSHLALKRIRKLLELRKDSCFAYEDLVEKREVTCQKSGNPN